MKRRTLAIITIAVLGAVSCRMKTTTTTTTTDFDLAEASKTIQAQTAAFMEAFNKGDSIAAADCYTSDAKFMMPNGPTVTGKENLVHMMSAFMRSGAKHLQINHVALWGNADALTEESTYEMADASGKVFDRGKGLVVWKQEDGVWKLHRDCFNSDMPPMPAK